MTGARMTDQTITPDQDTFDGDAPDASPSPPSPGVGFVGCTRRDRLLRVKVANRNRQRMRVECPHGCGEHLTAFSMARPLRDGEEWPDLVELSPDEPDTVMRHSLKRTPGDPGSGRRQVSDAAILEAIPSEDALAGEVAQALGYRGAKATSLLKRCHRINERAEAKGERPPITVTTHGPGHPTLIRRPGATEGGADG
jgi:hypothetical protein